MPVSQFDKAVVLGRAEVTFTTPGRCAAIGPGFFHGLAGLCSDLASFFVHQSVYQIMCQSTHVQFSHWAASATNTDSGVSEVRKTYV